LWYDFYTKEKVNTTEPVFKELLKIPVFARGGHVIPLLDNKAKHLSLNRAKLEPLRIEVYLDA